MRIGHYTHNIWEHGGVASYIRRISAAQRDIGHKVYYLDSHISNSILDSENEPAILVQNDNDLLEQATRLKLDILHLHSAIRINPQGHIATVRTIHGHQPYCPSGSRYLSRSSQPCNRSYSFAGCLWGHFIDRCGSIRPHNLNIDFQNTWDEMHILRNIQTIANSHFLKQQMLNSGYPENLINVLHYPAPQLSKYVPPPQSAIPHFLFLGRIVPQKGLNWLLHSLQEVTVPVHLDIAGDGYQEAEMRLLAQRLKIMEKVTFHGWINETKTFQLLQSARALIFPSLWHEPAGIVSLEAAAVGRPIIASQVGGIPEYLEQQQQTFLVKPNDVKSLAHKIETLALNWSLAKQLGEAGRKMVQDEFSMKQHLEQIMQLYITAQATLITQI